MQPVDTNRKQYRAGWSFDNAGEDFDEHIRRAIPLYESGPFRTVEPLMLAC